MERQISQREKILEHLKKKKSIAPLQALRMFGCMRLSQRIAEIESEGYIIEHKMIYEYPVKYCRYKLIRRKAA
jgi:hypothetical protein